MDEYACVSVDSETTGRNIRILREKCGLSKRELQESLGIAKVQTIYDWENGVKLPNIENVLSLARLLGAPIDRFLASRLINPGCPIRTEDKLLDRDRILEAMGKYEPMFAELLLEEGSIGDPADGIEVQMEDGTWMKHQYAMPEILVDYTCWQFRLDICNREDSCARFDPEVKRLVISEKGLSDKALLLHVMIHMHEYALNQLPACYKDRVIFSLYDSLKKRECDVEQRAKEHMLFFPEDRRNREEHDLLFYLKSLDLDLRMEYELGTVYARGKKDKSQA